MNQSKVKFLKFELEATVRQKAGRGASRRLRVADRVPAILYGAGEKPVSIELDHNKTKMALAHEAFYSKILTLKLDGKNEKVILKDLQRHPAKPRILHLDFLRVRSDQKLNMNVPLHFVGEENAPGLKEGGIFSHLVSDVEVSCFPDNLPEYLEVDVSQMNLNDTLHLTDLHLPKGVELTAFSHGGDADEHNVSVISIHLPRAVVEETVAPAVEETASTGATEEGAAAAPQAQSTEKKGK